MEMKQCPGATTYIWQENDTVPMLAKRLGTTEQAIWQLNGMMNLDALNPGDSICVPPYPLSCAEGTLYTVQENDTLLSIARGENVSLVNLLEHNPYIDPQELTAGEIVCLPKSQNQTQPYVPEYLIGVVEYGQTITDILMEFDISYDAFMRANPSLNPKFLLPGQRYLIPPSGTRGICPHFSYVILEGERLSSIASQFGISQEQLLLANPDMAPGDFTVGRTICLQKE